ncbi:MAG: low temperature requirement protein A [Acidimicrobiia bacterium]
MPSSPPDLIPDDSPPQGTHPPANWLELFYDLVFVAAILVLSSSFAHGHTVTHGLWITLAFVSIWWIWLATTMFTNRFRLDDTTHRVLVLLQMFLVALVAMGAADGVRRDEAFLSVDYSLLVGTLAVMYARGARRGLGPVPFARRRALEYTAAAVVFLAAAPLAEAGRATLWIVGFVITVLPAVAYVTSVRPPPPVAEHHLVERMGAFTLIVCGEAFVKVAIVATNGSLDQIDVVVMAFQFALVFAVWWIYFDDVPFSGLRSSRIAIESWIGGHLALQLSIVGAAIGVSKYVQLDPGTHIPAEEIESVAIPLIVLYLALIVIGICSRRRPQGPLNTLRAVTALLIAITAVATWQIDAVNVTDGVIAMTVIALLHAAVAGRLRERTTVTRLADPSPAES